MKKKLLKALLRQWSRRMSEEVAGIDYTYPEPRMYETKDGVKVPLPHAALDGLRDIIREIEELVEDLEGGQE